MDGARHTYVYLSSYVLVKDAQFAPELMTWTVIQKIMYLSSYVLMKDVQFAPGLMTWRVIQDYGNCNPLNH